MSELAKVIRWEDPPPARTPGKTNPSSRFSELAEELRRQPGMWALVLDGTRGATSGLASTIRGGKTSCFAPAGDFEAVCRAANGKRLVYARYLGDGEVADV